jgi:hypothetical protein
MRVSGTKRPPKARSTPQRPRASASIRPGSTGCGPKGTVGRSSRAAPARLTKRATWSGSLAGRPAGRGRVSVSFECVEAPCRWSCVEAPCRWSWSRLDAAETSTDGRDVRRAHAGGIGRHEHDGYAPGDGATAVEHGGRCLPARGVTGVEQDGLQVGLGEYRSAWATGSSISGWLAWRRGRGAPSGPARDAVGSRVARDRGAARVGPVGRPRRRLRGGRSAKTPTMSGPLPGASARQRRRGQPPRPRLLPRRARTSSGRWRRRPRGRRRPGRLCDATM